MKQSEAFRATGCGGLSGEHIQLCAEGARHKSNLSGERTEIGIHTLAVCRYEQSFCGLLIFNL